MKELIDRIKDISKTSKYVTLFQEFDKKIIFKGIGKIPGDFDKEYLEFLQYTNGASILDYCFLGIKNNKLGVNLYGNITDLWVDDCMLSSAFWGIVSNSSGENFGYINLLNKKGSHYIGYYSTNNPEHVNLVASSFKIFLNKLLTQVELAIKNDCEAINIDNNFFLNFDLLVQDDDELLDYIKGVNNNSCEYNLFIS